MSETGWVVLDTNVFGLIKAQIDPSLTLIGLLIATLGNKGIAAHRQLANMHGFEFIRDEIHDLPTMDEKAAMFLMSYRGKVDLQKVHGDDPNDVCFLVFAMDNPGAVLVTGERALLQIAQEQNISHTCVKAAVHRLDEECGGIFGDNGFNTAMMFDPVGTHPFLHYRQMKRCPVCDPGKECKTHKAPPTVQIVGS